MTAAAALSACTVSIGGPGTPTVPTVTSQPPERVLGPDGIGPLKVGMTLEKAERTGEFERRKENPDACMSYTGENGIVVGWSGRLGISSLTADNVRTPEGIGPGSTYAEVTAAYPELAEPGDMPYDDQLRMMSVIWTSVPDRPKAMYAIRFDTSRWTSRGDLTRAELDRTEVQLVVLKLKANQKC
ncbi:hypothetical protein ACFS5L_41890 [Streptomyces phyllanthi]|uniref:Lipoprotein n=1 Tax=Streptomyces phyllanthi TaxID=1803180 RepID=A0A5N8WB29_9ACTN|nr:hypothetical protein [Streptomyces phyllanthi]MPY43638.1 hypothetical protein [Streptomyces phyllanthi]